MFLLSNTHSNCYVYLSIWLSFAGYHKVRFATKMVRDVGKWPVSLVRLKNTGLMASPLLCLATKWFPEWALENLSLTFVQRNIFPLRTRFWILESGKRKWFDRRSCTYAEFQNFRNLSQNLHFVWPTTCWSFEAQLGIFPSSSRTFETRPLSLKIYKANFRMGNSLLFAWKLPRECSSLYHLLHMIFRPSQILRHVRESAIHSDKTFHAFCNISSTCQCITRIPPGITAPYRTWPSVKICL
jgi:hypothetical protein